MNVLSFTTTKRKNQRKLTAAEAFLEKLRLLIATHPKSLRFADAFSKATCYISTLVFLSNPSKADDRFHARHSAKSRQYVYRISKRRNAFEKKYCWWIKDRLNVNKMEEASKELIGMHDFISFSEKTKEDKSTKCLVEDLTVTQDDNFIYIRIKASHFLWKMVRRIVGTLVEVGRGNLTTKDIKNYLAKPNNEPAVFTAPPSGLFLEKVYY